VLLLLRRSVGGVVIMLMGNWVVHLPCHSCCMCSGTQRLHVVLCMCVLAGLMCAHVYIWLGA
jgi:hypothetical protein